MRNVLWFICLFHVVSGMMDIPSMAPTFPPVPPAATRHPTYAPVALTVITLPGEAETITIGLILGLAAVGVTAIVFVGVVMVNFSYTDEELGVADGQIIDVDRLRKDLRKYKELALRTRI